MNLDLEHHRRDVLLDHRLLKQIRQLTFLFGVEVVLVDIVDVEMGSRGSEGRRPQPTERMSGVTSRPVSSRRSHREPIFCMRGLSLASRSVSGQPEFPQQRNWNRVDEKMCQSQVSSSSSSSRRLPAATPVPRVAVERRVIKRKSHSPYPVHADCVTASNIASWIPCLSDRATAEPYGDQHLPTMTASRTLHETCEARNLLCRAPHAP